MKVVEIVTPQAKVQDKVASNQVSVQAASTKPEPTKEIETDGRPDYSDNPDPRLFAYNLFGELEPIQQKNNRRQQMAKPEEKPQPVKATGYRKLSDEELELYGSLNWDDNPPINGFYEAMMSIAHARIAERERLGAEQKASQEAAEAAGIAPGETYIEKTEGDFIPGGADPSAESHGNTHRAESTGARYVAPSFLGGYTVLPPQRFNGRGRRSARFPVRCAQEWCHFHAFGCQARAGETRHAVCNSLGNISEALQLRGGDT